jgi:hypothetical protein
MGDFSGVAAGSKIICGSDDFTRDDKPTNTFRIETNFTTVTIVSMLVLGLIVLLCLGLR